MNTLLLSILVANLVLEGACAYLLYKKRNQVKAAIQKFLGIETLSRTIYDNDLYLNARITEVKKAVRFVRRAQKAAAKPADSPVEHFKCEKVIKVLRETGSLIEAIKVYSNLYNSSLKDAKDKVEAMRDSLRAQGETI